MGCDYYIERILDIEYTVDNDIKHDSISLSRERGYIWEVERDDYDSDDPNSQQYYERDYLKVDYKPKILFQKNKWISDYVKSKYERMISELNINNINKITKKEIRYWRN